MLSRTSVVGLVAAVVALGLASPVQASGIKGGYRLVDLRAGYDGSPYSAQPRINDAGEIGPLFGPFMFPDTGDYTHNTIYDPNNVTGVGVPIGNALRRSGSDANLLPQALRSPDIKYYGVNSLGHIVGDYNQAGRAPFVYDAVTGDVTDLKFLPGVDQRPQVLGINNLDQMVGQQSSKALFYESPMATPIELAELLGSDTGWRFIQATGINNKGEIVGFGVGPDGNAGTFKLEPVTVPEPSSLLIFAALGLGAWRAARRGRAARRS